MPWGQRVISVCTKTPITEKMRFILIKNWMWKRRAEKSDPREVGIVAFFLRTTMTSKATPLHCVSHVSFLLSEYKSIIPHWWQFISAFDVYYTVLQVNVLKARYTDRNTAQKGNYGDVWHNAKDQAEHLISSDLDLKQPLQLRSDIKVQ